MACLPVMIFTLLILGGGAVFGGFIGGWSLGGFAIGALVGFVMELIVFMIVMGRESRRSTDTGSVSFEIVKKILVGVFKLARKYWKILRALILAAIVVAFLGEFLRMLGG